MSRKHQREGHTGPPCLAHQQCSLTPLFHLSIVPEGVPTGIQLDPKPEIMEGKIKIYYSSDAFKYFKWRLQFWNKQADLAPKHQWTEKAEEWKRLLLTVRGPQSISKT